MTFDEAVKRNPYNPKKGDRAAYCRYLRYNVNGWYGLDSKEVRQRWEALSENYKPKLKADICIMDEFAFIPKAASEDEIKENSQA